MNNLLELALAPTIVCIIYIYIRDKYEKEPIRLLLIGVFFGAYSTAIILPLGVVVEKLITFNSDFLENIYTSFVTSSGVEEFVKYLLLYFLVWRNKNFNEPFDGIVYATFISLGFAGTENIIYVFNPELGGVNTALVRAIFSVPGHGFFGITMGYYFALAKFEHHKKNNYLVLAFLMPWLLHSVYNFILLLGLTNYLLILIPFTIFMWVKGFKKIKIHLKNSPFK